MVCQSLQHCSLLPSSIVELPQHLNLPNVGSSIFACSLLGTTLSCNLCCLHRDGPITCCCLLFPSPVLGCIFTCQRSILDFYSVDYDLRSWLFPLIPCHSYCTMVFYNPCCLFHCFSLSFDLSKWRDTQWNHLYMWLCRWLQWGYLWRWVGHMGVLQIVHKSC